MEYFLVFILGSIFGSFLNCTSDRIIKHEKWFFCRSKCDNCGHVLGILDLFPIFSYIFLKGKCRYCGFKISFNYILSEVLLGILYVLYIRIYKTVDLLIFRNLGLITCLYGLSLFDLKSYEIPNGFIIFGIVWWLMFSFSLDGLLTGLIISGSILIITFITGKILKKEMMGGGDIKLFFMVSLYLKLFNSVFNIILACVIGLLFVLIKKKDMIPFAPSISIATYISLLVGPCITNMYINLF